MTTLPVVERLAALAPLASVPRSQIEWLAAHGRVMRFDAGEVLYSTISPPAGCYVLLSGSIAVRVARDGMTRTVNELHAGAISGRLPYSRMPAVAPAVGPATPLFTSVAEEPVEILMIANSDVREMVRECYDVTALCVHQMIDRTRLFKSDDLQREKMASLGRLAAGLAHELNNPSSAAARSASVLDRCRRDLIAATRALSRAQLSDDAMAAIDALAAKVEAEPAHRSPLADADREEEISVWLEGRALDPSLAEPLACAVITAADLERLAAILPPVSFAAALPYLASATTAYRLTTDIERATQRIDVLVAAVKRHTHMDRAPAVDDIDVGAALADTLMLADAKARDAAVSLTLDVDPGLPRLSGVPGQLNDVWMNLVDNAVDAAAGGGHITIAATREGERIVVSVVDDGRGIAKADLDRVFEPFFTTKPVGQGAGLGLDVVQRVVRSHGGSVQLTSRPGHTEFRVTLPVTPPGRG